MSNKPTSVLVTGGGGYVGGVLVPALLSAGYRVRVLDTFWFSTPPLPAPNLEVVVGDIRDQALMARCLDGIDAVIPLAAMSNDPSGDLQPDITREINLDASLALGAAARPAGVRRFVNISSASVYGTNDSPRVTESLETNPQTLYARYKADVEVEMLARDDGDFVVTSVRPATLSGYGPRMRLDLTVHILTCQAVVDGHLRVFGGAQQRPNLSVHDLVRALLLILRAPAATVRGRTFNLVETNYTVRAIADWVKAVVGRPGLTVDAAPTDDTRSYRLDGERARTELGFHPLFGVDHSITAVAAALTDGRVPDPTDSRWRNVAHLTRHPVQSWSDTPNG
ncbi:NAD-dependent epimerase/dehydratase family protein [Krasilnikovia sp. M28-CT-15]|uniref:NAD-dependent epimerase/dehydratase family protein n=1 Tax=Krasilnikovia sp. M28-CT-15 TaxID=3373540 RepID=UPI0038768FF1